jgi:ABC-type sugar transport system substrate-binding protein
VVGTNSLIDTFVVPINRMAQSFERIAEGDIAETITEEFGGLNSIKHGLILMMQRLHEIVKTVRRAANDVASNSEEMSASSEQMSQSASHQAAAAEEVSASMEEMTANIKQNASNALQATTIALQAAEDARESGKAVADTVGAMRQIAQKISIIEEIAIETRMLSLNATIEAARAQEHGKAFSVVASEVRKLSDMTKKAAGEINELTSSSLNVAEKAGTMLERLVPNIKETAELIQEISAASSEQSIGAEHVNTALQQLDIATQQNAQTAKLLALMAEQLSSQAQQLQLTIEMFKVPECGSEAVYDYAAEHHEKEWTKCDKYSPATFARKTYKIGFTIESFSHPHLVALKNDVEAIAAQYPNIELELISAEDDIVKQTLDLNELLQKGVDILLVQSTNPQMLFPGLGRAEYMGIPYFFCLRGALGVDPVAQVIASYSHEGKLMGEFIASTFKDGGNVVIIEGLLGDASSIARCTRFRKELEGKPKFKILASRTGQYRREPSRKLMEEFLKEFPRIDIVYGANDEAALGAIQAIRAAGRLHEITVVGVDGEKEALEAIKAGEMFATVTHGRLRDMTTAGVAMQLIIDYLKGKEIPRWLVSDARVVTKENVAQITPLF